MIYAYRLYEDSGNLNDIDNFSSDHDHGAITEHDEYPVICGRALCRYSHM